jgi:hypothetical protein
MAISSIESSQNLSQETDKNQLRREGFIDEALVRTMVMSDAYQRQLAKRGEVAFSSSENDYAGWNLSENIHLIGQLERL